MATGAGAGFTHRLTAPLLPAAADVAVWGAVALNVLRGVPVLWDGRHFLADLEPAPSEPRSPGDSSTEPADARISR